MTENERAALAFAIGGVLALAWEVRRVKRAFVELGHEVANTRSEVGTHDRWHRNQGVPV